MATVAILGTGIMGAPMARNLAAAGLDVRAWNRTAEKARALEDAGVTVAGSCGWFVAAMSVMPSTRPSPSPVPRPHNK